MTAEPGDTVTNLARVDGIDDSNTDNNSDDADVDVNSQGLLFPDIPRSLPRTGVEIAQLLGAAGLLILAGVAVLRAAKRRLA